MFQILIYVSIALLFAANVMLIVLLARRVPEHDDRPLMDRIQDSKHDIVTGVQSLGETQMRAIDLLSDGLNDGQKQFQTGIEAQMAQLRANINEQFRAMEGRMSALEMSSEQKLEAIRTTMTRNLSEMNAENAKKLEEIRGTVDEKLQTVLEKRIAESFRTVSEQLEAVYKGLGEMQTLAGDVGNLKKVLSGVKTRGILGEVQLGAILSEILTSDQYETNVATVPGSAERVEFAVKLPGLEGRAVYLPVDSKFPGERYQQLLEARESGERTAIDESTKQLVNVLCAEAKDIHTKYIASPYTTSFGIMFLPFEGLYAEAVNLGLMEKLRREYNVSLAGPSTMAALLNSLQMGFRTLAIEKRSNEVWELLGAVKTEFGKFEDGLTKMQGHLNQTSNDLETLMGTRSRAITRKLRSITALDEEKSRRLIEED